MKKVTSISIGFIVVGCWLASGAAWAAQPIEPPQSGPQTGGIPQCQANLAECTINLTDTEGLLQVCEDALAECQATEGQAFPATGQESCWYFDGPNVIRNDPDCTNPASAGQDGDIKAGATLDYTDTGLTIIDNNTKLEWMKQDDNDSLGTGVIECDTASYPGNLDKDCGFTWVEAFAFVASLNTNIHAGGGWRVPNVKELQSIANYETIFPVLAVSGEFDSGCVAGCTVSACSCTATNYWSSTSQAFDPFNAFLVDFTFGEVYKSGKFENWQVRAVRGGL